MTADAVYLDFEDPAMQRAADTAVRPGRKPKKRTEIPVLPASTVPIDEIRGHPDRRARACVNLRVERVPWARVVEILEYDSVEQARTDFLRVLSTMHKPEEAETMRLLTIANAETLLHRSMAMAGADFLVDVDAPQKKIPNRDRLRWHTQAGADLNLLAALTGVKAPVKLEITPTEEQYAVLTAAILASRGYAPVVEADVLELEQLPDEPVEEP